MIRKFFSKPEQIKIFEIGERVGDGFYIGFIDGIKSHLIIADKNNPKLCFNETFDNISKRKFGDYELPTIYELNLIFENFKKFNQVNPDQKIDRMNYWSSSKSENLILTKNLRTSKIEQHETTSMHMARMIKIIH